jgi:hypothetical protein
MNGINHLLRGRSDVAYERMTECFGFTVYELPISAFYIFNRVFVQKSERAGRRIWFSRRRGCAVLISDDIVPTRGIIAVISGNAYWTFVVHSLA